MAQLNFDANTVDPNVTFDPLPAAWYKMAIESSEMKPTKDGMGSYLELKLKVLEGQYVNRTIFDRLNLRNANATAQEIAYKTLSAICHATGVIQLQDSQQLHGIPMNVKVAVRAATGDYEASNDVKGYKNANEAMGNVQQPANTMQLPNAQQQPAQQQQQQAWQQPAQQPWQQNQQQQMQPQQQQQQQMQQPMQQQQQPQQQQQQPLQQQQQQPQQPWAQQTVQQPQQQQFQQQQQPQQQQQLQQQQQMANPAQGGTPPWAQQQQ